MWGYVYASVQCHINQNKTSYTDADTKKGLCFNISIFLECANPQLKELCNIIHEIKNWIYVKNSMKPKKKMLNIEKEKRKKPRKLWLIFLWNQVFFCGLQFAYCINFFLPCKSISVPLLSTFLPYYSSLLGWKHFEFLLLSL